MIKKICHLADIHIRKNITRHEEYLNIFKKVVTNLKKQKPDRIVIVGDLYHNWIDQSNEAMNLAGWFLNELTKIAPVIITRGNHDINIHNKNRMDSIKAVVDLIKNDKICYIEKTSFVEDDNVVWAVWHHGDNTNPWKKYKKTPRIEGKTYIDLFHNPINSCIGVDGYEFKNKPTYVNATDFKGDFAFLGDIHLKQYFKNKDKKETIAYPSSFI